MAGSAQSRQRPRDPTPGTPLAPFESSLVPAFRSGLRSVWPARTSERHGREKGVARGVGSQEAEQRRALRGVGEVFGAEPSA